MGRHAQKSDSNIGNWFKYRRKGPTVKEELKDDGTTICAESKTWLCSACGKKSRTKYGFDKRSKNVADYMWDESCMLNAILVDKE